MNKLARPLAVASAASLLLLSTTGPALAADRWTYRSTNTYASTQWVELGGLPGGVLGNVHVGYLEAYGTTNTDVWGSVSDWTCPEGELPPDGGGHGFDEEEPPPTNCELHSERFIFAESGAVTLTVDRKLTTARLTGVLDVQDHATGAGGRPPVDITWTGTGDLATYSSTGKYTEGGTTTYYKETGSTRQAVIADGSFIGAMGFTDDADDTSTGQLTQGKYYERGSSR